MIRQMWISSACLLGFVLVVPMTSAMAAQQSADSVVVQEAGGQTKTHEGRITEDNYMGMKLMASGGIEVQLDRPKILKYQYSASARGATLFQEALDQIAAGSYQEAMGNLASVGASLRRLPDKQKPLFGQHLLYYKALCQFHLGHFDEAVAGFSRLQSQKADTRWKFEAGYYEARCLEAKSKDMALNKYRLRAKEYKALIGANKRKLSWAIRWGVLCQTRVLRLEMLKAIQATQNELIAQKLSELQKMKESETVWALLDSSDKTQIMEVEAMAMESLEQYDALAAALNAVIRSAQKDNDRGSLQMLYLRRGNANWFLMGKATGAAKTELAEKVRFDYMHADLSYALAAAQSATANYRIAMCFLETKGVDWKKRTLYHLQKARSANSGAASASATKMISTVESMDDGAKKDD